jgi:hypothetical protein
MEPRTCHENDHPGDIQWLVYQQMGQINTAMYDAAEQAGCIPR